MALLDTFKSYLGSAWHVNSDAALAALLPATDGTVEAGKVVVPDSAGDIAIPPGGAASGSFKPSGALHVNVTSLSSSATTSTQSMMSYSLPANALSANGKSVRVTAWGTLGGNAQDKVVELNFGGVNINSGTVTQSGTTWHLTAQAYRLSSGNQVIIFDGKIGSVNLAAAATTDTSTDTGAISIFVEALHASASAADVVQKGLVIEYFQ